MSEGDLPRPMRAGNSKRGSRPDRAVRLTGDPMRGEVDPILLRTRVCWTGPSLRDQTGHFGVLLLLEHSHFIGVGKANWNPGTIERIERQNRGPVL